jgi:hypothetical protein
MRPKLTFATMLLLVFCVNAYSVQLSLPELSAAPGSTINVELSIDDTTGVFGGDIDLLYDPAVLAAKEVNATGLLAGVLWDKNLDTEGEVKLVMASLTGLPAGSGPIFQIVFEVKPGATGESPLTFTDVVLFEEAGDDISVTIVNGSVRVEIPTPEEKILTITDATANAGETFTVNMLIDDVADVAGGDIVLIYDPTMLSAESVTATDLLTGMFVTPNMDTPGRISISIASATGAAAGIGAILDISLKANSDASGQTELTFDSIPIQIMPGGRITVISAPPATPKIITITDATANAGERFTVNMLIDDVAGVAGGDIVLLYDPTILSAESVTATNLLTGMFVTPNMDTPGRINISIAGTTGAAAGAGAILDISLKAKSDASGQTELTFESAELYNENADSIPVEITPGGVITVIGAPPAAAKTLTITDATANAGEVFTVNILIDDVADVAGGDIVLLYDPAMLSAESVTATNLLTGMFVTPNMDTPGRINISIAGTTGAAAGTGAILDVSLKAKSDASGQTQLTFESAELYNENADSIPVQIGQGGVITVTSLPPGAAKTLTIADATGKAGEVITTSIQIDDLTDVAGGDIVLLYDSVMLSAESVTATNLLTGMFVTPNTDVAGRINISIASTTGATAGTGAILDVSFKAKEGAVGVTDLTFESAELYDESAASIPVESSGGKITISVDVTAVVKEHTQGDPMLVLQAIYNEANVHGHTYIDVWSGSIAIEAGQFLEFQVAMFSGNPTFAGSVDLHTADNANLRDSGAKDQNNISAHPATDLSSYARDQWYHRKISLDALAGKTLDGVMIATDSNQHGTGVFRVYVDNIQITDGEHVLTYIWGDTETEGVIPITGTDTSTGTAFAGTQGMSDYSVTIVGATPVTPMGKLVNTWGNIKKIQ